MWCSYNKTTSHNDADCRVQQHKAGGNAHVAAAQPQRVKGICSAYDLPEEDDKPEHPYIFFTSNEVQTKKEPATAPTQSNDTWSFGPLTASPWPFVECEKPAISLGGHDEPDLSYMCGGGDGEGEPLYGTILIESRPAAFKRKPSADDDSVNVLVDSESSGHTSTPALSPASSIVC